MTHATNEMPSSKKQLEKQLFQKPVEKTDSSGKKR